MKNKFTSRFVHITLFLLGCFTLNLLVLPLLVLAQTPFDPPNILIGQDRWIPEFTAGEEATLDIPLENTSTTPARNANITLLVEDVNKFPFKTDQMSFSAYAYSISRGTSIASFKVQVPTNAKPGLYPINVSVAYTAPSGGAGNVTSTIYVKIVNPLKQPVLTYTGIEFAGDKLLAGKITPVDFKIRNSGDLPLKDLELLLSGFTDQGLSLSQGSNTQFIPEIQAHETIKVNFPLYVDAEIKSGNYALDLRMKYEDAFDQEFIKENKIFLPVAGQDGPEGIAPRIMLETYDYGGGHILAGEVFPLTLTFYNTSQEKEVQNIKISLNADEQVFSPVGNSNTLYLPALAAQERVTQTLRLKPKEKAESQTYNINAEIDFQDRKGNKYTEKELISIPVNQTVKLVVPAINIPAEVEVQRPVTLPLDFYNAGRATIRNLVISTNGNFTLMDGEQFIGLLEAGKNDYSDLTIIPQEEGVLAGEVIFAFEDEIGTPHRMVKNFTLQVAAAEENLPLDLLDSELEEAKFKRSKGIISGLIALFLLGIGLFIYRKRKRAKKEGDLGDE